MKSKYLHIIACVIIIGIILSCSNSNTKHVDSEENIVPTATELEDLQIKYKELDVKDCKELFIVGNEMIDVYISTINRAYEGSERAKSDLLDFDSFIEKFDIEAQKVSEYCHEEFKEWVANVEKRKIEVNDKLMELLNTDYYEYKELDDSITKELDRQLKEMNEDIKKILDGESIDSVEMVPYSENEDSSI